MESAGKFEYLEHTADSYIRAFGVTMAQAYENAAIAMFEVMTDTRKVAPSEEETLKVEAEDQYALLYNWLEALLVKSEMESKLYCKFQIIDFEENLEGFKIKAVIWGEKFNPDKHSQKVGVKAVTYHRMVVIKEQSKVILEFILDI
jgi:SHS2 domain-containing protein